MAKLRKRLDETELGDSRSAQPRAWRIRLQERSCPTLAEKWCGPRIPAALLWAYAVRGGMKGVAKPPLGAQFVGRGV